MTSTVQSKVWILRLRRRFIWKEIEVEKATENLKKIIQDMLPEEAFSNCKDKDAEFSKIAE